MEEVSDPQTSPDGRQIVYTRRWIDKINDRRKTAVWILNDDGSRNRFLVEGSSPRWSPDGTRIAYLAEGQPKGTQIFVRWMDAEGAVTQITRVDKSPSNFSWSPDSESIAFFMMVPRENAWRIRMPRKPEGARWVEEPRIIERLVYRRDRIGFLEEGYRHVFVVSASGGAPLQLTDGDYDDTGGYEYHRTPISQTEEFYQALRYRKVPTAMIRFNAESHGITSTPSNYLRTQLYLHYWFEKHMTKTQGSTASSP